MWCHPILILTIVNISIVSKSVVSSSKILFYLAESSYSHRIAIWPFVEELSDRGHNVTFLSPFHPKVQNPKIIELIPEKVRMIMDKAIEDFDPVAFRRENMFTTRWILNEAYSLCEAFVTDNSTKNWVEEESFDLIIIDGLLNECGLGLVAKFQAPFIIYETAKIYDWAVEELGLPDESFWLPTVEARHGPGLTILQKLSVLSESFYWHFMRKWDYLPRLEQLVKENLNISSIPSFAELERNYSLVFVNTHHSFDYARAINPLVIPVGGLHLSKAHESQALSSEILNFLHSEEDTFEGFIFVSFGTIVPTSSLSEPVKLSMLGAFSAFPNLKFIWKWNDKIPVTIPKNILLTDWAPQQALLAHPKILAFITHAGLLSCQEAIYYGVPLIAVPLFLDQNSNAEHASGFGYGVKLEIVGITREQIVSAISSVVENEKYKIVVTKLSRDFKDTIMSPLETAIWWTEYVLRRNGDTLLYRPLSLERSWFERRFLDVSFILFSILFVLCYFMKIITTRLINYSCSRLNIKQKIA